MEMNVGAATVRPRSPLSSPGRPAPLKVGGPGINPPAGLTSPRVPACAPLSSNDAQSQRSRRPLRASATFSYRTSSVNTRERAVVLGNRNRDHYALLGVPCDASQEDIRVAYRRLALQYHPDVVPLHQLDTATEFFSEINRAYDTLSDPHKKKAYDDMNIVPPRVYSPRTAGFSYSSSSSAPGYRGKNWETDQCWC